jgi:hypothetical protein
MPSEAPFRSAFIEQAALHSPASYNDESPPSFPGRLSMNRARRRIAPTDDYGAWTVKKDDWMVFV